MLRGVLGRTVSSQSILVRSEHPEGRYATTVVRRHGAAMLSALGRKGELSVLVTTDAAIKKLNRDWRGKNKATDVLSFGPAEGSVSDVLGDVAISLDTARRQAAERRKPVADQLARLLAHGVLHLLGHDHEQPGEARKMAAAEVKLLGGVGLVGDALEHPSMLEFERKKTVVRKRPSARVRETN